MVFPQKVLTVLIVQQVLNVLVLTVLEGLPVHALAREHGPPSTSSTLSTSTSAPAA